MKHTIEELQFAATVREMVRNRQNAKSINMTKEEAAAYRDLPANDLIADVLEELGRLATIISMNRAD
ncbi:hypothetical protein [Rhodoferax ferrireducens]|uniref:hypothetical protein n=1 Tax=Rhodoferax ferrireducens TaxID=192843 RepID=UPI00130038EF|nr:hypothetical protein [Rhodoferax ferrireducens]